MFINNQIPRGSRLLALLFSILSPGLGQCYNLEYKKGVVYYILFVLGVIMFIKFDRLSTFNSLLAFFILMPGFYIFVIIDALINVKKNKDSGFKTPRSGIYKILIIAAIILYVFDMYYTINKLPIRGYTIASVSMAPTLEVGDYVMADLEIYNKKKPQLGDIVLFHYPADVPVNIQDKTVYVFSCYGISGDTIEVINKDYYLNHEKQNLNRELSYQYILNVNARLNPRFFTNNQINDYMILNDNNISLRITEELAEKLASFSLVNSIKPLIEQKGIHQEYLYPQSPKFMWNTDYFGPLYIPQKGATIELNESNFILYNQTIIKYEGNSDIEKRETGLYLKNELITNYTFQQNYYFFMGDNWHNAADSRFWGFVPEDHIIGRASYIYWSNSTERIGITF